MDSARRRRGPNARRLSRFVGPVGAADDAALDAIRARDMRGPCRCCCCGGCGGSCTGTVERAAPSVDDKVEEESAGGRCGWGERGCCSCWS